MGKLRAAIGWLERRWRLDRMARDGAGRNRNAAHLLTGLAGEDAAFFYLRRKGYMVVARRWSAGNVPGDMDLMRGKDDAVHC